MSDSVRELTHPSWRRDPEPVPVEARRESLMGQMVRAQLFFDRRTPAQGLPAWRDADGEAVPMREPRPDAVRVAERIGAGRAERTVEGEPSAPTDESPHQASFAQELNQRLLLAQERVAAEHVHLTQVDTVAGAYLNRPNLRLVK